MKETLTSHNYRDFNQRYNGTFGWLLKNGERDRLVHIIAADSKTVTFRTNDNIDYHANINSDIWFEFIPVNRAWLNSLDGETYLFWRVPNRQWRRGISAGNTSALRLRGLGHVSLTYELIANTFSEAARARNYPKTFTIGQALSKHFAIDKNGYVFFYATCVGMFSNNVIKLHNNLVYQELMDLIHRNNFPITVEIE